jgi:8-oxo-dGTP diphosphatase
MSYDSPSRQTRKTKTAGEALMSDKPYQLSLKAIVRDERGYVLLLRRSARSKNNAGRWDFPGGKVDPGEQLDEALEREVAEETGLATRIERVAGAGEGERPDAKVVFLFFEMRAEPGTPCLSSEHDEYAWIPADKLDSADLAPQLLPFAEEFGRRNAPQS